MRGVRVRVRIKVYHFLQVWLKMLEKRAYSEDTKREVIRFLFNDKS